MTLGEFSRLFAVIFLFAAASTAPGAAAADAGAKPTLHARSDNTARRLFVANRQRMLNELMAKSLCYVEAKVTRSQFRNQLASAQFVFQEALEHLIDGSPELGLAPEGNANLRALIDRMQAYWVTYSSAITGWSAARWGRELFARKVFDTNKVLAAELNEAHKEIRDIYVGKENVAHALEMRLADQQSMLIQKISKQFCQIAVGYNADEVRLKLKATVAQFAETADQLQAADLPGEMVDSIRLSQFKFKELLPILETAVNGKPGNDDVETVAGLGDELLRIWMRNAEFYQVLAAPVKDATVRTSRDCKSNSAQGNSPEGSSVIAELNKLESLSSLAKDRLELLAATVEKCD